MYLIVTILFYTTKRVLDFVFISAFPMMNMVFHLRNVKATSCMESSKSFFFLIFISCDFQPAITGSLSKICKGENTMETAKTNPQPEKKKMNGKKLALIAGVTVLVIIAAVLVDNMIRNPRCRRAASFWPGHRRWQRSPSPPPSPGSPPPQRRTGRR